MTQRPNLDQVHPSLKASTQKNQLSIQPLIALTFFFQACINFKIVSNDFRTASKKFKMVKMKTPNISIKDRLLENISGNRTTYD